MDNEVIKMIKCNSKIYSIQKKSRIENEVTNKSGTKENNQQNSDLQPNCINNYIKYKRFKPLMADIVQLDKKK